MAGRHRSLADGDLIRAARQVVAREGLGALKMRRLAKEVGLSAAGLYEYFGSKEELVLALAHEANDLLRRYLERVDPTLPPRQWVLGIGLAYLEYAMDHAETFIVQFSRLPQRERALGSPIPVELSYATVLTAVAAWMGESVEHGIDPGGAGATLRVTPVVEQRAIALWGMVHGLAMLDLGLTGRWQYPRGPLQRRALECLIDGLERS